MAAEQTSRNREKALKLVAEVDQVEGTHVDPVYAAQLPGLVRTALGLGERELAGRLVDGVEPIFPLTDHALTACRAQLAEANGNQLEAARLYTDAANRWHKFGNVPEHAYALLGQGRCLRALGQPVAETPLAEARDLFRKLGYEPASTETRRLLASSELAAS
jgi:tetratricopeptide (TPR) repeat protein